MENQLTAKKISHDPLVLSNVNYFFLKCSEAVPNFDYTIYIFELFSKFSFEFTEKSSIYIFSKKPINKKTNNFIEYM